jgi:hypothetical protein
VPAVYGLWISLHNWDFMLDFQPFVGLDNYTRLFRGDSSTGRQFWESMRATGTFMLYSVPVLVVLPLGIALLLFLQISSMLGGPAVPVPQELNVKAAGSGAASLGEPADSFPEFAFEGEADVPPGSVYNLGGGRLICLSNGG